MKKPLFEKAKKIVSDSLSYDDTVEVKIFQNKNNKQFNLPVLKKSTSPQIIKDIFTNKDIIGLKFKITDVIFKNNIEKDIILKNNKKLKRSQPQAVHIFNLKS